jgi:mono/diheme cytochrome c family protein
MKRLSFAVGAWVVAVTVVALAAQEPKSVNEGVYTAAQADRGAAVFKTSCTACHDTARFTGDEFLAGWTGKSLHALFDQMSTTMPEDNPGSLKPQQYADVVAYFLKLNGYPAGKTELTGPEALKTIKLDKKGR